MPKEYWQMTKAEFESQPNIFWRGDDVSEVRHSNRNEAIYFAANKNYASEYGEPFAAILNISRPFDANNGDINELLQGAKNIADQAEDNYIKKKGPYPSWQWELLGDLETNYWNAKRESDPAPLLRTLGLTGKYGSEKFAQVIKNAGYDSLIMDYGTGKVVAIIDPNQAITHKDIIKKALNEGKTIPPEVLESYPDLKPQSKITNWIHVNCRFATK